MARPAVIALSAFLLVLANLIIDVALFWLFEEYFPGSAWLDQIPIGILLSQLLLLALWLGLGDGRWYLRLTLAVALTLCFAKTIGIAGRLTSRSSTDYAPDPSMMVAFIFLAMLLAVSCFAFVVRRTRSWRLTWQQVTSTPATSQFQIGDALLWMIVVGGALASVRFLLSIDESIPSQLLEISLYTVKTTAVIVGAMVISFSTRRRRREIIFLVLSVLLIGAIFAVPDAWDNVQRMRAGATTPVPFYRYAVAWGNQTKKHEIYALAVAVGGLVNCFALRALGCQLIRPGQPSRGVLSKAEVNNGTAPAT